MTTKKAEKRPKSRNERFQDQSLRMAQLVKDERERESKAPRNAKIYRLRPDRPDENEFESILDKFIAFPWFWTLGGLITATGIGAYYLT